MAKEHQLKPTGRRRPTPPPAPVETRTADEIQDAADSALRAKKRTPQPAPVRPVPTPEDIQNAEDSELRAKKRARQRTLRGQ